MASDRANARRILVRTVEKSVLAKLEARGFSRFAAFVESRPSWDYHRRREDAGYDLISIRFDEKRRPEFYAAVNRVCADGLQQPWGEFIEAEKTTAFHPMRRILLLKERSGVLATLFARWFSHRWFGFRSSDSAEKNRTAAETACEEFTACLSQAEKWWATRELGPNLMAFDLGIEVDPAVVSVNERENKDRPMEKPVEIYNSALRVPSSSRRKTLKPGPRPFVALSAICGLIFLAPMLLGISTGKWAEAGKMAGCVCVLPLLLFGPIVFSRVEIEDDEIRLVNFGRVQKRVRFEEIGRSRTWTLAEKDWPVSLSIYGKVGETKLMSIGLKALRKDDVDWLLALPELKLECIQQRKS